MVTKAEAVQSDADRPPKQNTPQTDALQNSLIKRLDCHLISHEEALLEMILLARRLEDRTQCDKQRSATPRTDALLRSLLNGDKSNNAEELRARVIIDHARQLERELAEAKEVQAHVVQMPDGSPVAAPCAISGCQYSALSATAATTREPDFKLVHKDGRTFIYLTRWNIRVGELNTGVSEADAQKVIDFLTKQASGLHSSDSGKADK